MKTTHSTPGDSLHRRETWAQTLVRALEQLGPDSFHHLSNINVAARRCRDGHERPLTQTWEATIRRELQQHPKLFLHGGRPGYWGLRTARWAEGE